MAIDNFKRPEHRRRSSRPVDGFIGRSVQPIRPFQDLSGRTGALQPRSEQASSRSARRHLGNFDQPDGLHVKVQPHMRSAGSDLTTEGLPLQLPRQRTGRKREPLLKYGEVASSKSESKLHRLRRYSLRTMAGIAVVMIITAGLLFGKGYLQFRKVFRGSANTAVALQSNVNPNLLKGEGDGRVNILLLGIGGEGHDGPDLTDTMLVASVDPVNDKAALLSVPRDLWVKMPNDFVGNYQKINAAYEAGKYEYLGEENASNANQNAVNAGFKSADTVVNQVLGININYNVLVDFQAFQQAVNTVGGVTINVPTELYDPTIAWENNWNPVIAKAGIQTMNGNQALLYARSRETSSDFARTQRQRALLVALKDKALTVGTLSNPIKISQLISAFGNNVSSDISVSDAEALYGIGKKISNNDIQSIGLADPPNNFVTTADISGVSVVEPTAGPYNYTAIQAYVRSTLVDGYITKEHANITLLNGTSDLSLATNEATVLKSYGYNVGIVANAPTQSYNKTIIVDLTKGKDPYTANYLEKRFGVKTVTKLPDSTIQPGAANFVIILGEDAASAASQN